MAMLLVPSSARRADALVRYAAYWSRLHEAVGNTLLGTTAQGRDLFVTAPQVIEVRERTAIDFSSGVDLLAVGEARLAADFVNRAPCPVWFVPEGARPEPRRVLVPIDFSVQAADSLRVAADLTRLCGAKECVALHVYTNRDVLTGAWGECATRREAWATFETFMQSIDTLGVKVTPCFREAVNVAGLLTEVASERDATLVVMATRGRTWAASLLQPSIAEQTLRTCRVPLLTLKHFGASRGLLSVLGERLCEPNELRCN